MEDLALSFDPERMRCDFKIVDGDIAFDDSPLPALLISLGTDSRAKVDDPLPGLPRAAPIEDAGLPYDRRGWVGDAFNDDGKRLGCRLWLLAREKATEQVRRRAEQYAREGLAWAEAEGRPVTITSGWRGTWLVLRVTLGEASIEIPFKGASNGV